MSDLRRHLEEQMRNPGFAEEYERLRPAYEIVHAIISARTEQGLTQKELAKKSGLRQSVINRLEQGTCNPTLATLQALAKGMGKTLHIEFR